MEQLICQLKQERKVRSAALQQKLFEQFRMLNAKGEVKTYVSYLKIHHKELLQPEQVNVRYPSCCNMLICTN